MVGRGNALLQEGGEGSQGEASLAPVETDKGGVQQEKPSPDAGTGTKV